MYIERLSLYEHIEKEFDSKVLVYVTSDRVNMSAQIASDVIDSFVNQLDKLGPCKRISLYLYTRGGDMGASWNIVNLLRMYCDELQVIVPHKAHSAGTIISLGANEIIMTKQATLGPIDPSVNTPLNPIIPNSFDRAPVSVEAVKGYLEFVKEELNVKDEKTLADIYLKLSDYVHPLVLGQVYRTRGQIQKLAKKLLVNQVTDSTKIDKIVDFLCTDSGSHDYTINRREASEDLGLKVVKPSNEQYKTIKKIYDNISEELQLTKPFNLNDINGEYSVRRCILESIECGSDCFVTEGRCAHVRDQNGTITLQNQIIFEGWRHEISSNKVVNEESESEEGVTYERGAEYKM